MGLVDPAIFQLYTRPDFLINVSGFSGVITTDVLELRSAILLSGSCRLDHRCDMVRCHAMRRVSRIEAAGGELQTACA
jgi:hypothetical protein